MAPMHLLVRGALQAYLRHQLPESDPGLMSTVYQGSGPSYMVFPHPHLPELTKVMPVEAYPVVTQASSVTLASCFQGLNVAVSHVAPEFSSLSQSESRVCSQETKDSLEAWCSCPLSSK